KGLAPDSLELVVGCLQGADEALSAQDVATLVGMSRVTARRYLEHLADGGQAGRRPRYGGGRPGHVYRGAVGGWSRVLRWADERRAAGCRTS
ncbi:MAG: helix-turn-helix domain-containing protein, partial [Frankiales bacterium]|nr:helix-turn-helix domain-containing protein [Frankiales bacterium]